MTALVYRVEGTIKSYAMSPFQALTELELSKALTRYIGGGRLFLDIRSFIAEDGLLQSSGC